MILSAQLEITFFGVYIYRLGAAPESKLFFQIEPGLKKKSRIEKLFSGAAWIEKFFSARTEVKLNFFRAGVDWGNVFITPPS